MTDKELLTRCQTAFDAIPIAAESRKVLRGIGVKPIAYAGNGSHILAKTMAKMIDNHLKRWGTDL